MPKYFDTYRVKRNIDYQPLMLKLIRDGHIFKDYSKILMISAMIGYINKAYIPIVHNAEPVQLLNFSERDRDVIDLMAYAHTKEQLILDSEKKYTIFECYANGGFPILIEKLNVNEKTVMDDKTRQEIIKRFYSLLLQPQRLKR